MFHFWHEISKNWQAILTLVVSTAVGFISWLQWQTAKKQAKIAEKQAETAGKQWQTAEKQAWTANNKLRLDLFERRIVVYDALMRMTWIAVETGDVSDEERLKCAIATKGAEFLFDKNIDNYSELQLNQASDLHGWYQPSKQEGREANHSELRQWFRQQWQEMPRRFSAYLTIEQ
jgi:hypothetical protein